MVPRDIILISLGRLDTAVDGPNEGCDACNDVICHRGPNIFTIQHTLGFDNMTWPSPAVRLATS